MIRIGLIFVLLLNTLLSLAQSSYVYIEGIKGIPFGVLSEGKEASKLGKSYFIIPYSEPGEKNIDITFLNSNFEKQKFVVDVQANSSYGFRLGKTDENKFYLIDIVNEGQVIETNSAVNLALSTSKNIINFYQDVNTSQDNLSESNTNKKIRNRKEKKIDKQKLDIQNKEEISIAKKEPEPVKYGISETILKEDSQIAKSNTQLIIVEEQKTPPIQKNIKVNNCSKIASELEVKSILDKIQLKGDDEDKLLFIKKKTVSGCFTSKHIYAMAEIFETQYGRISLVKFILPLTSDPSNLITMESLFKYDTYKSKLRKLLEN